MLAKIVEPFARVIHPTNTIFIGEIGEAVLAQ